MNRAPVVTLTTDFGLRDPYVAEVKAALHVQWRRWPQVAEGGSPPPIVDVTHDVPPGDIAAGAWIVARTCPRFPPGSVHVVVVDPGVGTERPALALRAGGHFYVGPGNGLFAHLAGVPDLHVVRLDRSLYHAADGEGPAPTFHGRDVFAPAAAHLAQGVPLDQLGSPAGPDLLGEAPRRPLPGGALGRVVWIDRFGNAITDIPAASAALPAPECLLRCRGVVVAGPRPTFGAASPGRPFWYRGSGGTVELALRDEPAAARFGWRPGDVVTLATDDQETDPVEDDA